jgi:hypothetical protein
MADSKLNVVITATDHASKALTELAGKADKMSAQFSKMGKAMLGVGTALGVGMAALTTKYAKAGDEVAKMAKRTQWGVESLSELRHVADISGMDLSQFELGTRKLSGAILDASYGMETYTRAFDELGLSVDDLMGMGIEEQFWTVAYALADLEDETVKAALATDLFGRTGTNMFPMLAEGKEGIAALRQEAHDLNIVYDEESALAAENMMDAQTRLKEALSGLGNTIATVLMPDIQKLIDSLTNVVSKVADWSKAHPELVKALEAMVPVLIGAGGILFALSKVSKAIMTINTAMIVMQSLSGPKGWAMLAIAAGVAGGALVGMNKLMAGESTGGEVWNEEKQEWEPKASMASGGVVPGPVGQPVPIIAHGGEVFAGVGGGFGTTVNVYVAGSVTAEDDLAETVRQALLRDKARNVDTGL